MWVKICANTNVEDTLAAIHLGAHAVGFVFAPSKRQVNPEQVRAITAALPSGPERVGVFPAWPAERIAEAATYAGLTTVQLHGGFNPDLSGTLRTLLPALRIVEVAHWTVGADAGSCRQIAETLEAIVNNATGLPSRVLIDARVEAASGGTGTPFNWDQARPLFASAPGPSSLILAGGLRPENVRTAIQTLHPWGVDVASGVEAAPGVKDHGRLRDFLNEARPEQVPFSGQRPAT